MAEMPTLHPVVLRYQTDATRNAERQIHELRAKLTDILQHSGVPSSECTQKARDVIENKRRELEKKVHVSINTKLERVLRLVEDGKLKPAAPKDIYSKLHRRNAERVFGTGGPPLYLNPA